MTQYHAFVDPSKTSVVVQREHNGSWYNMTFEDSYTTSREFIRSEPGKYEELRIFTFKRMEKA